MNTTLDTLVTRSAQKARPCLVQQVLDALPDQHSKALADMLANSGIEHVFIKRRLTDAGISVGEPTIRRHRNGDCCCPKGA